ncbi:hypothetical protein [Coxiella-like endosymbiont]|uniref:hypothetical protein n=1 Tax=Coxiella-like endosymbiont TaxID=1592897 RepID=UPI0027298B37|nr:hypothetical protein [Coxiella-like endosymbiont]
MIFKWSESNDLLIVNKEPTMMATENAVKSRIKSLKKLTKLGYKNFILFNIADLAKTTRYQKERTE